jgi:hypothetical protein
MRAVFFSSVIIINYIDIAQIIAAPVHDFYLTRCRPFFSMESSEKPFFLPLIKLRARLFPCNQRRKSLDAGVELKTSKKRFVDSDRKLN